MNIWTQIPFLRLLLPFIAGISTAIFLDKKIFLINYLTPALFILIAFYIFIKRLNLSYAYSWVFGLLITIMCFVCGFQFTVLNTDKFKINHFSNFLDGTDIVYIQIDEPYLEKEKSFKFRAKVLAVRQKNTTPSLTENWINTSGDLICYFLKDEFSQQIRYGDCLIINSQLNEINPPQNPSEFNYKEYLSHRNIYHQTYIPSGSWKIVASTDGNTLLNASYFLRDYLLTIYKKINIKGDELAVGSALVLGYDDKVDPDLINAYAGSGALHVLSVSGLHVGILFFIFNSLLLSIEKYKYGKIITTIALLFILWFYATLTGLSPSVLRSAAMFSFIVIAQPWKYNTNIFNTLAVSCFALLLYNPYLIMDVGFQLSFLAVAGIISIHPWLYEKWEPKMWLIKQIWFITSVSIAAQIVTFPLGIFYFHQFPNYFLLSNLVVIPLSTIILCYGILLFVIGGISFIGIACGKLFSGLVWLLNTSVQITNQLPGATIQEISINNLEAVLIYLTVFFLLFFMYNRELKFLSLSLVTMIILLASQIVEVHSSQKEGTIIVYNIPKISAYSFTHATETTLLADASLLRNQRKLLFHIKPDWWKRNIKSEALIETNNETDTVNRYVSIKNNYVQFHNKRIVVIDTLPIIHYKPHKKLYADLIILSKSAKIKIQDLQKLFEFKKIIIDSSNSEWINQKWKKECRKLNINFYSVLDSGAYVEEM